MTLTSGDAFANVTLERLSNDTLYFRHKSNFLDRTEIDSIRQIVHPRDGAILPATLVGAAGGGAVGYALKPLAVEQTKADVYSLLFGVVVGGAAGYFIGDVLQPDEVVELTSLRTEQKRELLRKYLK